MDIIKQNDFSYTVVSGGKDLFTFRTFKTPEVILTNYNSNEDYLNDLNKFFIDVPLNEYTDNNQSICLCAEPTSYDEDITVEEWALAFNLIFDKFKSDYHIVYFKLMVIGTKFSFVCAKCEMVYITNMFTEYFDEEFGMKNQEFLIYSK